jgi:hypothetical protein
MVSIDRGPATSAIFLADCPTACRPVQVQMERIISAVDAKDWTRALAGMVVVVIVIVMEECGVEEDFMRSGV